MGQVKNDGNGLSAGELGVGVLKLKAASALAAGSLLVAMENGLAVPFSTAQPMTTVTTNNVLGPVSVGDRQISSQNSGISMTHLSNGNNVITENVSGAYKFTIINAAGSDVVPQITVGTHVGNSVCTVSTIGDRFVITTSSPSGVIWYQVFNNDGTAYTAELTLNPGFGNALQLGVLGLSADSFIIYYMSGGAPYLYFNRFNALGVQQGSGTTSAGSNISGFSADGPFSDGSFTFYAGTSTGKQNLIKYTAAGVPVFNVQISDAYAGTYIDSRGAVVELLNGNLCTSVGVSTDNRARGLIINPTTGAVLYSFDPGPSYSTNLKGVVQSSLKGGFVMMTVSTGAFYLSTVSDTGTLLHADTLWALSYTSQYYPLGVYEIPGMGFVSIGTCHNNTVAKISLKALAYSGSATIGGLVDLVDTSNYSWYQSYRGVFDTRMVSFISNTSNSFKLSCYNLLRSSIVGGLISGDTVKNGIATVKTSGNFYLTDATQIAPTGTAFDTTANTVPGAKGKFLGNTVIIG